MKFKKVTAVYFSATGTNKTTVCTIASGISETYDIMDLTKYDSIKEEKEFLEDEIVVIGAPVYAGRIYEGALHRFLNLRGNNTPCVITATYGNRHYDDALLELKVFMENQGFIPIAAAATIGEHTYGSIQVGRPDKDDQEEDLQFAKKVVEKIESNSAFDKLEVPGNYPYREGGTGGGFRPLTLDSCNQCGLCASACPEGAISLDDCMTIDNDKCIACFRCIRICPTHAKNMDTPEYNDFAEKFSIKLSKKRKNEYYL